MKPEDTWLVSTGESARGQTVGEGDVPDPSGLTALREALPRPWGTRCCPDVRVDGDGG